MAHQLVQCSSCLLVIRRALVLVIVALLAGAAIPPDRARGADDDAKPAPARPPLGLKSGPFAWTTAEAREALALHPHDAYLQYVMLQLGRAAGEDRAEEVRTLAGLDGGMRFGREDVDLFSLFTGALAVQESLQLESMTGGAGDRARTAPRTTLREGAPRPAGDAADGQAVDVTSLQGPGVKSHPWEQMLAGRKPEVSPLSQCVPADFYMVECRSLAKLLDVLDAGDLFGTRLGSQGMGQATDARAAERLRAQLAIRSEPLMRPFYDTVVESAAITGSDPFVREGTDVTLLFRLKQPALFRGRMASFMDDAEKATAGAKRSTGEIGGVKYVQLSSPERDVNVFAADPAPDLHVRSNSKAALARVLAAMRDGGSGSLGRTKEFAYVRTLMPPGAAEEDVLVYLSDPFIRRLVGPVLKLTERRRVLCYNHLRLIAHASLMFQTGFGRPPASTDELLRGRCLPDDFGAGKLACPDGGTYALSADGHCGACSVHGRADRMVPCLDLPLARVTSDEAERYKGFVEGYNQYWRRYFDPIAIRLQVTPDRFRVETIILPLIDNSIYTALSATLGGKPEPLDALPTPKRSIFSLGVRVNKELLIQEHFATAGGGATGDAAVAEVFGKRAANLDVRAFVDRGLGNQVGVHVYDAPQAFGLNLPDLLGDTLSLTNRRNGLDSQFLFIVPLIVSLNSPVYLSFPVKDAKVVDDFLAKADAALGAEARAPQNFGGFLRFERDFYQQVGPPGPDGKAPPARRGHVLRIGPITWRFFWERIGDGFYIASKSFVLDDLRAAQPKDGGAAPAKTDGVTAHAMVQVRPENFDAVLPEFRLSWAENNRRACLDNLGPLSDAGRAVAAAKGPTIDSPPNPPVILPSVQMERRAAQLFATRFFCPDGGRYELSADGKHVTCSVHGSPLDPRQPAAPARDAEPRELLYGTAGVTASLTFLEDGLRAVVTVKRK